MAFSLVFGMSVFAQSQKELGQLMFERNEYYFTLTIQQPAEIQDISRLCSVDGIDGKTVVCYANQQQYDKLLQSGYKPSLMTPPSMLEESVMWDGSNRASYEWDSYPTYDAYQSMMEAFPSQALSDRSCTLLDLGTLNSGRKILGIRLNNGQPEGKPKFLYSSTMHGDEVTGMMLMLRLIDEFCTSTDSRILNILDNVDLFIFPLTNPDGTYYGGNSSMNSARRYNINGVDLNRNYKDYFKGDHPDGNAYALETQWTMQLADDYLFTMSANYHGGAEVMNYPWDAVYTDHADKEWYELVCSEYVSHARAYSSSYMTDTYSDGVTNGAEWYVITGSRQDYENAYGECREITVECSTTKKPSASTMPTYWNYNHTAMLALIEQCMNGIHGLVYDSYTHQPIEGVTVMVQDHDINNSQVTSHSVGDFHRPIKGGTYTLAFTKDGYETKTVNVTVIDNQRVDLDTVFLISEGHTITQISEFATGWNPWTPNVDLDGATLLSELKQALGTNGISITAQNGKFLSYNSTTNKWNGTLSTIDVGSMYKIKTANSCEISLNGPAIDPATHAVTIYPGNNWIGFFGTESMSIEQALANYTPTQGDSIIFNNMSSSFNGTKWNGTISELVPGNGYIYKSNATTTMTIFFQTRQVTNKIAK